MPVFAQEHEGSPKQILALPLSPPRRHGLHVAVGRMLGGTLLVDCPSLLPVTELKQGQAEVKVGIPVHGVEFDAATKMPDRQRLQPQRPGGQREQPVGRRALRVRSHDAKGEIELGRRMSSTPLMQLGHGQEHIPVRGHEGQRLPEERLRLVRPEGTDESPPPGEGRKGTDVGA